MENKRADLMPLFIKILYGIIKNIGTIYQWLITLNQVLAAAMSHKYGAALAPQATPILLTSPTNQITQ